MTIPQTALIKMNKTPNETNQFNDDNVSFTQY